MQNWIEPIKITIEKYTALKKFIETGEYNKILDTRCALCNEAWKFSSNCSNCVYMTLYNYDCRSSKNFNNIRNHINGTIWSFGDIINHVCAHELDSRIRYILYYTTREELLEKLDSRINFLNNMLKNVLKEVLK